MMIQIQPISGRSLCHSDHSEIVKGCERFLLNPHMKRQDVARVGLQLMKDPGTPGTDRSRGAVGHGQCMDDLQMYTSYIYIIRYVNVYQIYYDLFIYTIYTPIYGQCMDLQMYIFM